MLNTEPNAGRSQLWLHLFTSSIRELYIADAIDLLAAPEGAIFRFRYEGRYIEKETRAQWQGTSLIDRKVALHFSLQHPADFYLAIFVPLRVGKVVSTQIDGDTHIIYFRLMQYLPLSDDPNWTAKERKGPVHAYTAGLKELLGSKHHPDSGIHATLGPSPSSLLSANNDPGGAFAVIVRFLTPTLSFSPRTYWRAAYIIQDDTGASVELDDEGNVPLTAGKGYTLYLSHYQYEALKTASLLRVAVPKAVDLVGSDEIALRSRYDMIPIRLFPPFRDDVVSGEMSIATEPSSEGPTVRLPVIVSPPLSEAVSGPMLGVGAAVALAMPAIFASDRLLTLRIVFAATGALIAGIALWLRRQKGLPS